MANSRAQELKDRVVLLEQYFNLDEIDRRPLSLSEIDRYYRRSSLGYSLFHSKQGSIHMALNPEGVFSPDGYQRAPRLALDQLLMTSQSRVLELGSGAGYNLLVVGPSEPDINFHGVDLSGSHVRRATSALRDCSNVSVQQGDFQDLQFSPGYFTGAFSIESFCHALDTPAALESLFQAMATGGRFVVIDAWQTERARRASDEVRRCLRLTERSMAVSQTMPQSQWLSLARAAGWALETRIELSKEVLPNLERFEKMAQMFLRRRGAARLFSKILRLRLLENVVAGFLMAESVRAGFHTYDLIVLRKP